MKRLTLIACFVAAMFSLSLASQASASSIGAGLHYLRAVGDFDDEDNIDENDFGILGSLQFGVAMLKAEANAEYVFSYLGSDEDLFEPSAYLLLGSMIYGGAGIGIGHINGDWQSDPFYALRLGVDFPIGKLSGDIYGTYRFQKDDDLEDLTGEDLDSVTLAGVLRYHFGEGGDSSGY